MDAFQLIVSPDVVDVLRDEHRQIRQLCTDIRLASPDRRPAQLAALLTAVHLHQLGELKVVHPAVRNIGPTGDAAALACQTKGEQLERSLIELDRLGPAHPAFDARFATISGALLDHAAGQERDEFPLLRRYVTTQRLHMMSGAMHDVRAMALD